MNYPIYCINLKERLDRKKHVEKELKKIDIQPTDVIFLEFYRHKNGGRYGCYDSHMKVWNDFYTNHPDKELCIIFEDDFEVTENSKLYLKKAITFVEKNKDNVDFLFLNDRFIRYSEDRDKNKKCIDDKYFINMINGSIMDSMHVDCFAKYANDAEGYMKSDFKNNAKIGLDEDNNVCIIAKRNIKSGVEIFCGYGKEYWKKHG